VIAASDVSAVLVTRGDVDLAPIVESLAGFGEIVIWDNSVETDLAVYGRYAAIERCARRVVFVQDDDVVLDPVALHRLCLNYEPAVLVANMPQRFRDTGFYDDHCLVGFGAILDRDLPAKAFRKFDWKLPFSERRPDPWLWRRTCDITFTALTPRKLLDLPYTDREFASAPNRMWKQGSHVAERARMLELVRQVAA